MSTITRCRRCGGNIVEPSWEGDGAYPVAPMCECEENRWRQPDDGRRGMRPPHVRHIPQRIE